MRVFRSAALAVFGGPLLLLSGACGSTTAPKVPRSSSAPVIDRAAGRADVDYVAIGPRVLLQAAEPLLAHREARGLGVERIALEDIIPATENQEDATAPILEAIRKVASASGSRLRFVLLVGDAPGYDELDPERSLVPTFYRTKLRYLDDDPFDRVRDDLRSASERRRIRYSESEYATDQPYAYAHIDAPGQPSLDAKANPRPLAVGRIPARLAVDVVGFAKKVIRYETTKSEGAWRRSMTIFTGPADFGPLADFMIENTMTRTLDDKVPYDWDVDIVFPKLGSPWAYPFPELQEKLVSRLEEGALIAGYVGHGAPTHFDDVRYQYNYYQLGSTFDLEFMQIKEGQPFFISLTCSNGFFDLRERIQSIAEVMALNPRGAIASFASSRNSHPYSNALYGDAIVQTFITERAPTIGEGIVTAKQRMREGELPLAPLLFESDPVELAEEHMGLYNLFGDPATVLQYPSSAKVTIDGETTAFAPGTTVNVNVESNAVASGKALLTIETKRSVVRAAVPSAIALKVMPEREMWDTLRQTYKAAVDKVVSRDEQPVANGKASFKLKLPETEGDYAIKVLAFGGGETSTGHLRVKLAKPQN
ncbi:MAG: hypothetical protein IPM54_23260 [Polyangiaceae bacterium]|nr:hypothetical protein [Polyangiaceae bacterium]